jgi:hypothetical protein
MSYGGKTMANATHTPGPWNVTFAAPGKTKIEVNVGAGIFTPQSREVAMTFRDGFRPDEQKANAHLLAAAPNLLASLREMLEAYWGEGDGSPPPEFIKRAQAAIAKAEGR